MWLTRLIFLQNFILIWNQRFSTDSDNFWYPDQALASPLMFLFWVFLLCYWPTWKPLIPMWLSLCRTVQFRLISWCHCVFSGREGGRGWWGGDHRPSPWFQLGKSGTAMLGCSTNDLRCPKILWSHESWSCCEVLIRFSFHVDKFRIISNSMTDPLNLTTSRCKKVLERKYNAKILKK